MIHLKKIKGRTLIIIGIVILVVSIALYVAIKRRSNSSVQYTFAPVERGDIENTISSTGTLNAKGTVEVGTQVSGTIDKIYVDFNDKVRKGQVLAVLDTTTLAASVRDAEANLLKAQAQHDLSLTKYEDAQELYQSNLISEVDFKTAKTDYEVAHAALLSAQANYERARVNFKYAVIRSPIDGTIINRNIEPGQTVAASFSTPTLFVITKDLSQMEIHAYVDESDIGQIKKGQAVRFTVDAYPDETFNGTVRQIRLQPETVQNVVNYTVVVDATNDKELMLPGMTATVDFIVEQRQHVLLISNAALQFQPTQKMLADFRKNTREKIDPPPDSIKQAMKTRFLQGGFPGMDAQSHKELPEGAAMLWYFDNKNTLNMIPVRTGATDGKNTEIVEGRGIKEGMKYISGIAQQGKLKSTTTNNQQQKNRAPGPPPIF
jgi:HlyD family secretion protein